MSLHETPEFGSPSDGSLERFAAELASLSPQVRLDRDRLMYLAGQASVTPASARLPGRWLWPAAFGSMTTLAASLLVALLAQPGPRVVEKVVQVPIPVSPHVETEEPLAKVSAKGASNALRPSAVNTQSQHDREQFARYLDLRDRVLVMGLESWASDAATSGDDGSSPADYHQMLNRLLHEG